MAYDRYDTRDAPRSERSRWSDDDRYVDRQRGWHDDDRGSRGDRGIFERAGDEIASWFGDDEAQRRRHHDLGDGDRQDRGWTAKSDENDRNYSRNDNRSSTRDFGRDRSADYERRSNWNDNRGMFARGGSSASDYDRNWRREFSGRGDDHGRADRELDRGWSDRYQPITGDYGRGGSTDLRSGSPWAEDEYRGTSRAGSANWSDRSRYERSERSHEERHDPHYQSWRNQHMRSLDRDYDDYRAENQSRFESDFGSWREKRQQKRGMLEKIHEQMEVVGNDNKHIGTVDKVAGDRIILTKSDPESGGIHRSLSCSTIDRLDNDKVVLDCSSDQARQQWRDENRSRALFEREDRGEMGPRMLDRSFEGTYR